MSEVNPSTSGPALDLLRMVSPSVDSGAIHTLASVNITNRKHIMVFSLINSVRN